VNEPTGGEMAASPGSEPGRPSTVSPVTIRLGSGPTAQPVDGNFYEQVGGRATFEKLVREFYRGVASDPPLLAIYPEADLEGAIQRLTGFLEQYWGGPGTYSELYGHPRLRLRHAPFSVTPAQRDRWLNHMRAAVDSLSLPPLQDATLWAYLERAAFAMVNSFAEESE
jgi:hemoglobin